MGSVTATVCLGRMGSFHFRRLNFFLAWRKAWTVSAGSIVNGALGGGKSLLQNGLVPKLFLPSISSDVLSVLQGTLCKKIRSLQLMYISTVWW